VRDTQLPPLLRHAGDLCTNIEITIVRIIMLN
jgi:hypothetical protein